MVFALVRIEKITFVARENNFWSDFQKWLELKVNFLLAETFYDSTNIKESKNIF